jgi:hypothetical protein
MPTPKSSGEGNTTKKIITDEMIRTHSIAQLGELRKAGWDYANPVKDWRELMPDAKDQPKSQIQSNFFGGTVPAKTAEGEQADKVRSDPELQQMAALLGVDVNSLLVMREMMLDRHGQHYSDTEDTE